MKISKITRILLSLICLASWGCSTQGPSTQAQLETQSPPPTKATPTSTPVPTATPTPLTPTPTSTARPTKTPTPLPDQDNPVRICAGAGQVLPTKPGEISGTIIYQKSTYNGLFTLGGTRYQQGIIDSEHEVVFFGISPDGNWLAYAPKITDLDPAKKFSKPQIILLAADGKRIEQRVDPSRFEEELQSKCCCCQGYQFFDTFGKWINNDLLYMNLGAASAGGQGAIASLPKIFNPFTGQWDEGILNNLPDIPEIIPGYAGIHPVGISPDLSRAVYDLGSDGLVLSDLDRDQIIWTAEDMVTPYGTEISWSPDGAAAAVVNIFYVEQRDRRLFLISRAGAAVDIVHSPYSFSEITPGELKWSPDGRYLAFVDTSQAAMLYLYDTRVADYVFRCPLPGLVYNVPTLVWSPDGKWIAFSDQPEGNLHLLNTATEEISRVLDNVVPVAWSASSTLWVTK